MITSILRAGLRPTILNMVAKVYIPVLFPLTFMLALSAMWLDHQLGFGDGFIPRPYNYGVAVTSFVIGATFWLWTYEQLTRLGEGSPSPTAGRTVRLVTTGIYAYSRNPSVWGKLLGVLAVGFALNSISLCFIFIPLLLTGSLIEKVWRQEPQLVDFFGEEYLRYRRQVPLFFPWKILAPRRGKTKE